MTLEENIDRLIAENQELMREQERVMNVLRHTLAHPNHVAEVHLAGRVLEAMKDQRGFCNECKEEVLDLSTHGNDCPAYDESATSQAQYNTLVCRNA